ncbi:ureidoglycolate lyase [Mesorhizobium sp. Z1-4]|uniref:ureidoglycolate lyase n=1 Tax=Mesorhizobium sp. Z1-4 TaxID=2448478 RepID=UPI000FD6CC0B|nr:ureidoglycolate lyase [Mesorhizobium sp. Z1-4]
MKTIVAEPLTRAAFAEFGDVLDTEGDAPRMINGGMTERFHDLAKVEATGEAARVLVSIFRGQPYEFPLQLKMVERHPLGSQAFMPLSPSPFLVAVCHDSPSGPLAPRVFVTRPGQGVNYRRHLWHAVLTPISQVQDFLVVDRGGEGNNLEEHYFDEPYLIELPETAND